jgi:hypothetical protein
MTSKARFILATLALSLAAVGTSESAEVDGDLKARSGTLRCGGNNALRVGGTEIQTTFYDLRNFNSAIPITVERLTFYDANGLVLFDSNTSGFPPFSNGVLGPSDNVLDPNQTAELDATQVLPFLPLSQRPVQVEITWSAPQRALTLDGSVTRVGRDRDPATGAVGAERSRSSGGCRTISVNK